MLTHAGKEACEIYKMLLWTGPGDKMKYDKVVKAFREYSLWTFFMKGINSGVLNKRKVNLSVLIAWDSKSRLTTATGHKQSKLKWWKDKFVFGIQDDNLKEHFYEKVTFRWKKLNGLAQQTKSSSNTSERWQELLEYPWTQSTRTTNQQNFFVGSVAINIRPKECPAFGKQCTICKKVASFCKIWLQQTGADPGIPKGGLQWKIYMHSYSKYIIPIGSFLEGSLNLAWSHK